MSGCEDIVVARVTYILPLHGEDPSLVFRPSSYNGKMTLCFFSCVAGANVFCCGSSHHQGLLFPVPLLLLLVPSQVYGQKAYGDVLLNLCCCVAVQGWYGFKYLPSSGDANGVPKIVIFTCLCRSWFGCWYICLFNLGTYLMLKGRSSAPTVAGDGVCGSKPTGNVFWMFLVMAKRKDVSYLAEWIKVSISFFSS